LSETSAAPSRYRPLLLGLIVLVAGLELFIAWLALHPNVDANYRAYYIDQTTTCLNKPVTGEYRLGATVSFMPDDQRDARHLRVCGWAGPGGDGTHSVGTISRLRFAVAPPKGNLILQMWVTAIIAPDGRAQHIILRSGTGVAIGEATIPAGETRALEFIVPPAAISRTRERLDLFIRFPTAAAMAPHVGDTDYRSIKLMSVQLRRPGDPPSQGPQDDPRAQRYEQGP
jgi:hypothetical protein